MPHLNFTVDNAEAVTFAAAPTIAFHLRAVNADKAQRISSIALRCQIQIEAGRRHYDSGEREDLRDLFGDSDRWSQTLRPMLWTHATATVPEFSDSTVFDVSVPCTFDFNVAAAKYFHALQDGDVPLLFLFSGTVFHEDADGAVRIEQIGWDKEAKFRLPARVWKEMMDHYYPNSAWLRLRRDVFDRLYRYKIQNGIPTWEQALESLLP